MAERDAPPDEPLTDEQLSDALPTDAPAGDEQVPARPARGRARRVALLSLRLVAGTVSVAAAALTIAVVGLVPIPIAAVVPAGVQVVPVAADQLRVCPGSVLRLGDESGENADIPIAIGVPSVRADAIGTSLARESISNSDASTGGTPSAPQVLRIAPGDGAAIAGAQSQVVDARDYVGFAAAACSEPSGSIWLAGGSMAVGRTSILTLTNPTAVGALVTLTILGEKGPVEAPGMNGIDVPPGSQKVVSLAGFAPGLVSPVIHVEARGGQVTASLQQSIVRGLDAVGVDLVDAAPDPATYLTFPGVRIFDSVGTNRALSLEDWSDVAPIVRILNTGAIATEVTVSVTPLDPAFEGTSFPVQAEPGTVTDVPLDAGTEVDSGVALADGLYTVTMSADQPIVGGVRVSAAADIGAIETEGPVDAPVSDLAWYSAAPLLTDDTLLTIAPGPDPTLTAVNPTATEIAVVLQAQGGADITLVVPAGGAASTPVEAGTTYVLREPAGLFATVSYAADDRMASYPVSSARPVSGPILIRP
ncbi:MAG: DUF5719 family protein [Pseudolysinimonas sp.]